MDFRATGVSLSSWAAYLAVSQQERPNWAHLTLHLNWGHFFEWHSHSPPSGAAGSSAVDREHRPRLSGPTLDQIWNPQPGTLDQLLSLYTTHNMGEHCYLQRRAQRKARRLIDVSCCCHHSRNALRASLGHQARRQPPRSLPEKSALALNAHPQGPQEGRAEPSGASWAQKSLDRSRVLGSRPSLRSDSSLESSWCGITPLSHNQETWNSLFLPQVSHDRAISNVRHKPGTWKASNPSTCVPATSGQHLYWMRQNQQVENCWPAFPSASPYLLVCQILLLRSLVTTVLPLNKMGILFIWGDCCHSRPELLACYKVNVLFNVHSRQGCGAVYSLPPPEGHYL